MENTTENQRAIATGCRNKFPGPVASGIFFSLTTIFLTYGAQFLPFKNGYLKSGLGEVLLVFLPAVLFLIIGRFDIKETLKLRTTRPINFVIVFFLMIFAIPVTAGLNAVVLGLIRLIFGKNLPVPQIIIPDVPTLFIAILVIGVSAAVCEEVLFRGLITKGYRDLGVVSSIVITSVLFGILHRDLQKAVATIVLGALIGFIVYRTRSIYVGMLAHFTNNAIAVIIVFGSTKLTTKMSQMGIDQKQALDISSIPTASLVIVIIFYGILFLGCLACFGALLFAFYKSTEKDQVSLQQQDMQQQDMVQQDMVQQDMVQQDMVQQDMVQQDMVQQDMLQQQPHMYQRLSQGGVISPAKRGLGIAAILSLVPGIAIILLTFIGQILYLMSIESGWLYNFIKFLGIM